MGESAQEVAMRTWWSPQNPGAGPEPAPQLGLPAPTVMVHDMTTWHDRCYLAVRDKGLVIVDISDIANPEAVGEVNWADQQPRPTFDRWSRIPRPPPPSRCLHCPARRTAGAS
jgi:hypothetical protein